MVKSSADDGELRRACEAAIEGIKQKILMSFRVAKSRGIWGKSGKLGRGQMAKPRILALSSIHHVIIAAKAKGQRAKAFLRVLKYSNGGVLEENTPMITKQTVSLQDGPAEAAVTEGDMKVRVERELVSQAEEEDMEALLGTELQALEAANVHAILENEPLVDEVLQGLESASNCVEDMDEWLGIFNVKLRHMREDIESIETRNNNLEMHSVNNKSLIEELDKLLERLCIPSEYASCLAGGSFDEARMLQNIEACEWLTNALRSLEVPSLDPSHANMRAVREKRAELDKVKTTFVRKASEFLRNYFASLVDFMISDKSYISQCGRLKRLDHADLRYKCRTYTCLLQHLKSR